MPKQLSFARRAIIALAAAFLIFKPWTALAIDGSLIRDAEIENTIRQWADPIFNAAGLDPNAVRVYLINNKVLNAFVAGGQNIFFTTGLLMRSESAGQVIGVLAHETGHIAGGHLARMEGALKDAGLVSIISALLGAGAMAVGGGEAGAAVMTGGQHVAERQFLHYSRTQEGAADQAALTYLEQTGQSARGLLEFMQILGRKQSIAVGDLDPYTISHPLTKDRVSNIAHHLENSPHTEAVTPSAWVTAHARMRAKLIGFIMPLKEVMRQYPAEDSSIEAHYARAIAYYRIRKLDVALPLMDALLEQEPGNPYFHELKGQMLFENGHPAEAIPAYRRAVELLPGNALLKIGLARALLEFNRPDLNKETISILSKALKNEKDNTTAWHLIGSAYGREGHKGLAALSLAEKFVLAGNKKDAMSQAKRALELIEDKTPSWYRARDIIATIEANS